MRRSSVPYLQAMNWLRGARMTKTNLSVCFASEGEVDELDLDCSDQERSRCKAASLRSDYPCLCMMPLCRQSAASVGSSE